MVVVGQVAGLGGMGLVAAGRRLETRAMGCSSAVRSLAVVDGAHGVFLSVCGGRATSVGASP